MTKVVLVDIRNTVISASVKTVKGVINGISEYDLYTPFLAALLCASWQIWNHRLVVMLLHVANFGNSECDVTSRKSLRL